MLEAGGEGAPRTGREGQYRAGRVLGVTDRDDRTEIVRDLDALVGATSAGLAPERPTSQSLRFNSFIRLAIMAAESPSLSADAARLTQTSS